MLIEPLETRIAPAVLIGASGRTATFTDVDGDLATVSVSAGTLTTANFELAGSGQLRLIDLSAGGFDGANLTVTAKKSATGDGRVNVGTIDSTAHDLGVVKVNGDLSRILAGDASAALPGIQQLSVDSFGRLGIDTQPAVGSILSTVEGGFGALLVKGDFVKVALAVPTSHLGVVKIGGSLIGGEVINSGLIFAGTIGSVQIGRDLRGGADIFTGVIMADGIGSLKIGGSLVAGASSFTALINVPTGNLGAVTIGHSLVGGDFSSASIAVTDGSIGAVSIGGDVIGSYGDYSARIQANGNIESLKIKGSLIGGAGEKSGQAFALGTMGPLSVGNDLHGGSALDAGSVQAAAIKSIRVGGSIIGGGAESTGLISCTVGTTTMVSVGGSVLAGDAVNTGQISSNGRFGVVKIGGDLVGGDHTNTGYVRAGKGFTSVAIGGSIIGGAGNSSGYLSCGNAGSGPVSVGGSVIGGSGPSVYTGGIRSDGDMSKVKIGGDLIGGSITDMDATLLGSGFIQSTNGRIAGVSIGGSIISGSDYSTAGSLALNGSIRAADEIGSIVVKGNVIGNFHANGDSPVIITARGQDVQGATTDVAIGRITIGGDVESARILAGYDPLVIAVNADAQIGAVKIGGAWTASSLVAGAEDVGADGFGNFFDTAIAGGNANIVSRIASITIGKLAIGTPEALLPDDHYGFVAQQVGSFKANGRTFALTAGGDSVALGPTNDLRVREVA